MKFTCSILFSMTIGMMVSLNNFAQDGAQLFKAKCNTCHMVDKNSTGPVLKGVKQKWEDAGEGALLYEWVKNPQNLIASGKSKLANEIKSFSPTDMTPQSVSLEEIDAILAYVDNYEPPTPPKETSSAEVVEILPDYEGNLQLFYWLLALTFVLMVALIVLSGSIKTLLRSDYLKKKMIENANKKNLPLTTILLLIGLSCALLYPTTASALTFQASGEAAEGTPYLLVEKTDLYMLIALDLILLGVLFYLRGIFKSIIRMARPEEKKMVIVKKPLKKLNAILSDIVPIEDEHQILLHHEYDGIKELDNNLPPWWVWTFYATILFAIVYLLNYHVFRIGDLQITAYEKDVKRAKTEIDAYLSEMAMNVDESNVALLTDGAALDKGKALFQSNCVACHNSNGEGNIGPNLTDKFWIYGPDIKDVFVTIKNGTPNGMPEHASKLNPVQLQQISSYVLSLPATEGKEPEGKEY